MSDSTSTNDLLSAIGAAVVRNQQTLPNQNAAMQVQAMPQQLMAPPSMPFGGPSPYQQYGGPQPQFAQPPFARRMNQSMIDACFKCSDAKGTMVPKASCVCGRFSGGQWSARRMGSNEPDSTDRLVSAVRRAMAEGAPAPTPAPNNGTMVVAAQQQLAPAPPPPPQEEVPAWAQTMLKKQDEHAASFDSKLARMTMDVASLADKQDHTESTVLSMKKKLDEQAAELATLKNKMAKPSWDRLLDKNRLKSAEESLAHLADELD